MSGLLALKLILSPSLIAGVTLAGRRWGTGVSGWLAGLPITGGPILLVITLEHGGAFAADTARSALAGLPAFTAFCIAFAWTAQQRPWWIALLAGYAGYAACAPLCAAWHPSTPLAAIAAAAVLFLGAVALPRGAPLPAKPHSPWELPLRMAAAALIVLVVTGLAHWLGTAWSGVLTAFPTAATVLGVFTQRAEGPNGAASVLRALLLGMIGFVGFLAVAASGLAQHSAWTVFAVGLVITLAIQGATIGAQRLSRRRLNAQAASY